MEIKMVVMGCQNEHKKVSKREGADSMEKG